MHTGCPMQIVSRIPHQKQLSNIKSLSDKAKFRLKVIDWYNFESKRYSKHHKKDALLTCRHFGICRSTFYCWLMKYNPYNLLTLEDKSRKPKKTNEVRYSYKMVCEIRKIREEYHLYDGVKIRAILLEHLGEDESIPSSATINRIIHKYNMFYRADSIKKHMKLSIKAKNRKRVEYMMRATHPNEYIEFDMKHINLKDGKKVYAMCGIDQFTRKAVIHITSSPSSYSATIALQKIVNKFGKDIKIINDNGSENMGKAEEWLKNLKIEQYFAHPYKPKDKPFIERFIGTYQREFLDENYDVFNVKELQEKTDEWLKIYETYRPHKGLNLLTPSKFEYNFYSSNKNSAKVSNM